jgi:hypothetical protein
MAESLVVKSRLMGKITLAALKEGAFDASTGALEAGAESYEVKFEEGDLAVANPGRNKTPLLDRGDIVAVLHGDQQPATLQFTAHLRDFSDTGAETLMDIAMWLTRDPWDMGSYGDYVSTNWESVYASAAGTDAIINGISVKFEITNPGDSGDTHVMIANQCYGSLSFQEGDPDTISLSLTCTNGGGVDPTVKFIA